MNSDLNQFSNLIRTKVELQYISFAYTYCAMERGRARLLQFVLRVLPPLQLHACSTLLRVRGCGGCTLGTRREGETTLCYEQIAYTALKVVSTRPRNGRYIVENTQSFLILLYNSIKSYVSRPKVGDDHSVRCNMIQIHYITSL